MPANQRVELPGTPALHDPHEERLPGAMGVAARMVPERDDFA
jgi:hypothetical protein